MHFRGGKTIRDLLVISKDNNTFFQKSGVMYRYNCCRVDYEDEYTGESGRTLTERLKEHLKAF